MLFKEILYIRFYLPKDYLQELVKMFYTGLGVTGQVRLRGFASLPNASLDIQLDLLRSSFLKE